MPHKSPPLLYLLIMHLFIRRLFAAHWSSAPLRHRADRPPARCSKRGRGRTRARACRSGRIRPSRARAHRHRLRRRGGARGQVGCRAQSHHGESACHVESLARARYFPRPRTRTQSCLPVHRPRLPVRQHARDSSRPGPDCYRNFRGSRSRDDAAARQAAQCLHLRRQIGRKPGCQGGRRPAPDGDHSADGAGHRPRSHAHVSCLWHRARFHDGPQPGRIRRPGCLGRSSV